MALILIPDDLNQGTEVTIDTTARTFTLNTAGNLSDDGATRLLGRVAQLSKRVPVPSMEFRTQRFELSISRAGVNLEVKKT